MWTKEETDQLFDLCERFDLRFIVIADRFPSSRTVEELKDRYYSGNVSPALTIISRLLFKWLSFLVFFFPFFLLVICV